MRSENLIINSSNAHLRMKFILLATFALHVAFVAAYPSTDREEEQPVVIIDLSDVEPSSFLNFAKPEIASEDELVRKKRAIDTNCTRHGFERSQERRIDLAEARAVARFVRKEGNTNIYEGAYRDRNSEEVKFRLVLGDNNGGRYDTLVTCYRLE